jgi:hypothetical protein
MNQMNPKARSDDTIVHPVDREIVVFDKNRMEAHRLNETASRVWALLDGERSINEISESLGVDESIVSLAVDDLVKADLIERGEALTVSRRAALRRVAAAAAVGFLLPAVTTIAAPHAAQAQSQGTPPVVNGNDGGGQQPRFPLFPEWIWRWLK